MFVSTNLLNPRSVYLFHIKSSVGLYYIYNIIIYIYIYSSYVPCYLCSPSRVQVVIVNRHDMDIILVVIGGGKLVQQWKKLVLKRGS